MNRQEIHAKIDANALEIKRLKQENLELSREDILLSDEAQRFEEKMEMISIRKNGKRVKEEHLIGRIFWKEDFKDEDSKEVITIDRSQVVRIDGNWNF